MELEAEKIDNAVVGKKRGKLMNWLLTPVDNDQHLLEVELTALALQTGIVDACTFPKFHCCEISILPSLNVHVKLMVNVSRLEPNWEYSPLCRHSLLPLWNASRNKLHGARSPSRHLARILLLGSVHSWSNSKPLPMQILPVVATSQQPGSNGHGAHFSSTQPLEFHGNVQWRPDQ